MRPVFASSAEVRVRERMVLRGGRRQRIHMAVRFGIFEHPQAGLTLIDAGYGPEVAEGRRSMVLRGYNALMGPHLLPDGVPEAVLARLGRRPEAVRRILVTHFHPDHVCALHRFPQAEIIASRAAWEAMRRRGLLGNLRQGVFAELLPADLGERLVDVATLPRIEAPLGLGAGGDVFGDGILIAVDLPGHAEGHYGLCFARESPPLLYATDTQWLLPALDGRLPGGPARLLGDAGAIAASARRVAAFKAAGGQVMLCHDPALTAYDMAPK